MESELFRFLAEERARKAAREDEDEEARAKMRREQEAIETKFNLDYQQAKEDYDTKRQKLETAFEKRRLQLENERRAALTRIADNSISTLKTLQFSRSVNDEALLQKFLDDCSRKLSAQTLPAHNRSTLQTSPFRTTPLQTAPLPSRPSIEATHLPVEEDITAYTLRYTDTRSALKSRRGSMGQQDMRSIVTGRGSGHKRSGSGQSPTKPAAKVPTSGPPGSFTDQNRRYYPKLSSVPASDLHNLRPVSQLPSPGPARGMASPDKVRQATAAPSDPLRTPTKRTPGRGPSSPIIALRNPNPHRQEIPMTTIRPVTQLPTTTQVRNISGSTSTAGATTTQARQTSNATSTIGTTSTQGPKPSESTSTTGVIPAEVPKTSESTSTAGTKRRISPSGSTISSAPKPKIVRVEQKAILPFFKNFTKRPSK